MKRICFSVMLFVTALGWSGTAVGQTAETPETPEPPEQPEGPFGAKGVPLFSMPGFSEVRLVAARLGRAGRFDNALVLLRQLDDRFPDNPDIVADQAGLLMALGDHDEAMAALTAAEELGFYPLDQFMRRPFFDPLRERDDFKALFEAAKDNTPFEPYEAVPAAIEDRVAMVTKDNTEWDQSGQILRARFDYPSELGKELVSQGFARVTDKLLDLYLGGHSAGNVGDLYDNRDNGHSQLRLENFPQVAQIRMAPDAVLKERVPGINNHLDFDTVTIGNSSTAVTGGSNWRSLARFALTAPGGAARLYQQYRTNRLYVYPEHRDHDPDIRIDEGPAPEGFGDLFPANTPYYLISQGSSGSDRSLLRAAFQISAAFRPETKKKLIEMGLVAPAIQWAVRHGIKGAEGEEGYLSPLAHPTVFRREDLDVLEMIRAANRLKPDDIPPVVQLRVEQETRPNGVTGMPAPGRTEKLFDTPSAIARIWRSVAPVKQMTVSAAATTDPNGRELEFKWVVLRGSPNSVLITPKSENGEVVDIRLSLNPRAPVPGRPDIGSDRVDIGVFAFNGVHHSAPAFISVLFPPREAWAFERAPDGNPRVRSIEYSPENAEGVYADPLLFAKREWTDVFQYETDGRLLGWTRVREDGETDFTATGEKVTKVDARGRVTEAEQVRYQFVRRGNEKLPVLLELPTDRFVTFRYSNDDDFKGERILPDE